MKKKKNKEKNSKKKSKESDIKAWFVDLDGTLTDGIFQISNASIDILSLSPNPPISKNFHTRDFFALQKLQSLGYFVAVVTRSDDGCGEAKCRYSGIPCYSGIANKANFISQILQERSLEWKNVAYIGDAENDIECMRKSRFRACPSDAIREIRELPDIYISDESGGKGAVYGIVNAFLKNEVNNHKLENE